MACGMPILAVAGGETKRIIEEAGCGYCCSLGDVTATASAIAKFIRKEKQVTCNMSQAALQYFRKHFDKNELLDEIEQYVRS